MPRRSSQDSDLLREIRQRRAQLAAAPARSLLTHVLDSVNAMGVLARCDPDGLHAYGPGGFAGEGWAGAVRWCRGTAYHDYKTLRLIGVWALLGEPDTVTLLVGSKTLAYTAPFFNADAYHKTIRADFRPYYDGDAAPPAAVGTSSDETRAILWQSPYHAADRLRLRQSLTEVTAAWAASQTAP